MNPGVRATTNQNRNDGFKPAEQTMSALPDDTEIQLGDFELHRELGRGGMVRALRSA